MKNQGADLMLEQIRDYWRILLWHKWWISLGTLGLTLISILVIAMIPDVYRATTTILVDPQKIPDKYVTSTVSVDPNARLGTITQEVMSATRLQEIIDMLGLYPDLRKKYAREELLDYMRAKISVQVKQGNGSGLSAFTITYEGRDPNVVAQVTNQIASNFIDWNLKEREQQAIGTTEFLAQQLQAAKQSLEEQETKLREFKMQHLGEMPEQQAANLQALSRLQTTLQANADALNRLESESTLLMRGSDVSLSAGAASRSLSEREQLELQKRTLEEQVAELEKRYTPKHPDVVAVITRLQRVSQRLQSLPAENTQTVGSDDSRSPSAIRFQLIQREMKRLNDEQKQIKQQIVVYQAKVDATPVRDQQLAELTRNYQTSKEHYDSLLDKSFSADMAADLERKQKGERFIILDPAKAPEKPFKPARIPIMAGSAFGWFAFSILVVLAKEQINPSVRSETELKQLLPASVPVLALIPDIENRKRQRQRRGAAVAAIVVSLLACIAVIGFLLKVKPIL